MNQISAAVGRSDPQATRHDTPNGGRVAAAEPPNEIGAGGTLSPVVSAAGGAPAFDPQHGVSLKLAPGASCAGGSFSRGKQESTPWSVADIARALALWESGLPAAEIAAKLGRTKNMVCGLARRKNFPARPQPGGWKPNTEPNGRRALKPKPAPRPFQLPQNGNPSHGVSQLFPPMEPREAAPIWRSNTRSPLPIPRGAIGPARSCQWTDCERAPWLFCDAPTVAGYSWCRQHKAAVFRSEAA
jgi:hypothetical protein